MQQPFDYECVIPMPCHICYRVICNSNCISISDILKQLLIIQQSIHAINQALDNIQLLIHNN